LAQGTSAEQTFAMPAECKPTLVNGTIFKEWTATYGEFKGLLKPAKPPMGCSQPDWSETLQKWLIVQFFVACVAHPLTVVLYALAALLGGGDVVAAITGNIVGVLWGIVSAFLTAWLGWFMLIKRQPYCCCVLILWFENWTYTHLLFGIFTLLNGVQFLLFGVRALLSSMDTMAADFVGFIFNVAATAMFVIIAITQIYVGRAAVGVGQKIAGITLPAVTAGKGEGEQA